MCDLCGVSPEQRRDAMEYRAKQLNDLAERFRLLGHGQIKAHSNDTEAIGIQAQAIIRFLVEDWL